MKRIVCTIVVLAIALTLCGCASGADGNISGQSEPPYVGTWIVPHLELDGLKEGLKEAGGKVEDYQIEITDEHIQTNRFSDSGREEKYTYDEQISGRYTYLEFIVDYGEIGQSLYYLVLVNADMMFLCPAVISRADYTATSPVGVEIESSVYMEGPGDCYVRAGSGTKDWPMKMEQSQFENMMDEEILDFKYFPSSNMLFVIVGDDEYAEVYPLYVVSGNLVEYMEEIGLITTEQVTSDMRSVPEGYVILDNM